MNVKAGDLAIIVASGYPSDIGMICEVLRACPFYQRLDPEIHEWECRTMRPTMAICSETGEEKLVMEFDIPDSWLRPVPGILLTDDVTNEEKVSA